MKSRLFLDKFGSVKSFFKALKFNDQIFHFVKITGCDVEGGSRAKLVSVRPIKSYSVDELN